ncbi:MAG: putative heme d1 biosynthesis radical SAM protein NirJ2 [Gracilibacteraceae bacterium]|jgi:putative heme d1 biosynthesis radical SAM protein NirJ2|nr:putative heme d1 biosynthesis radical SAM protein NirJ2 [Gracilibacteraceae bacterium]
MIISWNTTNACNLYCAHCYRDAGVGAADELTTAEGKTLLDQIGEAGFRIMIFSGGEPLLRPDIFELVRYAVRCGLRPVLGSNGTLLNAAAAARLKEAGAACIGISLDSLDQNRHDELRGQRGSWEAAVNGMRCCRAAGLPFQVHTTVMGWNDHEVENITDFAVQEGAAAHHIFFLVPTGRAADIEQESLRAEQYEDLLTRILRKQQETAIELKPTCAPQFMRIAKQLGLQTRFTRGCLAGTAYCIIGPRGDVQPCAYLNMPLGNVRERSFAEIWRDSPVLAELRTLDFAGGCGRCAYKSVCGGCRARAWYYHGSYMAEEPWCLYGGRKGY